MRARGKQGLMGWGLGRAERLGIDPEDYVDVGQFYGVWRAGIFFWSLVLSGRAVVLSTLDLGRVGEGLVDAT